jgi:hypothetical protein
MVGRHALVVIGRAIEGKFPHQHSEIRQYDSHII